MRHRRALLALVISTLSCGDNVHHDIGSLVVSPQLALYTDEGGATATFTVALTFPPTEDLVVTIKSGDTTEGIVSPATLTFDAENFADAQTVTITGQDDRHADGDLAYHVFVDGGAHGTTDVVVTNGDNDEVGIVVSPIIGLTTSESGGTAMFTVGLSSEPTRNVIVPVVSSDPTEGTTSVTELTFTPVRFAPVAVVVTGVPDVLADGDVAYSVVLGAATSIDPSYNGIDADDVEVTNIDDVAATIAVTPTSGLVVSEAATQATFTVVLLSQPTADVTIPVTSSDTTEATVSTASLVFTDADWDTPRTVTVTGVNDAGDDGDQPWTIVLGAATSSDPVFGGVDPTDVTGTTTDNDGPGVSVSPTSGLSVTEAGTTTMFTVVLQSQPSASVTIPVMSSDTTEATVSTATLTFTTGNWNTPQPVTVTGADDLLDDGNVSWTIALGAATSTDTGYAGVDPTDVTGTTVDNDTAAFTVTPTSGLTTTESGGTATFTVRLTSQPTASVTVGVSSSDTGEGTPSPTSLVFDDTDWMTPQTVTVTGVDDNDADGAQAYSIVLAAATSSDTSYGGMNPPDVAVTNTDNEVVAGFVFDTTTITVSEFRDSDSFAVSLTQAPTANVVISFTSGDTSEGTVGPTSLTFTPQNWDTPQSVTVTGVDDNVSDGPITFAIVTGAATSTDPAYSGLNPPDVAVTTLDNDTAAIYVKARTSLFVTESGSTTTFRVRLTVAPTATVTCPVTTSDATEGAASPASLVFQPNNFGYQTVTITGVDDTALDGDVQFLVVLSSCTSTDFQYNGVNPRDVAVINRDNE